MKEKWVLHNFTKSKMKTEEENVKLKGNNKGLEGIRGSCNITKLVKVTLSNRNRNREDVPGK